MFWKLGTGVSVESATSTIMSAAVAVLPHSSVHLDNYSISDSVTSHSHTTLSSTDGNMRVKTSGNNKLAYLEFCKINNQLIDSLTYSMEQSFLRG